MVDPRGENNQITLLQPDPHPIIVLAPDIEESRAIQNISDLLILMQMLMEEALHLFLVNVTHLLGRHGNLIPVLVVALFSQCVDIIIRSNVTVENTQVGEIVRVDAAPGVVGQALVALKG